MTQRAKRPDDRERELVRRMLDGDERAFAEAVRAHTPAMLRVAAAIVGKAAAHDVVQDAWISVLRSLAGFEGRSSLRRWLTTIAANHAKTRLKRDGKTVPFSAMNDDDAPDPPPGAFRADGMWEGSQTWATDALRQLEVEEAAALVLRVVEGLPPQQRAVITLRDIEGWSAEEVCNSLELSEVHQRVLLHRARVRVRAAWIAELERRRGPSC